LGKERGKRGGEQAEIWVQTEAEVSYCSAAIRQLCAGSDRYDAGKEILAYFNKAVYLRPAYVTI